MPKEVTMLKIAVAAPMPTASVTIAVSAKAGDRNNVRAAYRASWSHWVSTMS